MQRHQTMLAVMGIVFVPKSDTLSIEGHDSVIGNGDAVGVAAEIPQYLHGVAEGRLGVNKPILPV
jgi:hypothetical protein